MPLYPPTVADPLQQTYSPGSFIVVTENYAVMVLRLILTSTQRLTIQGTARLRIT